MPGPSGDGLTRRHGPGLARLLHFDGEPVVVAFAAADSEHVVFAARARSVAVAQRAIERIRFATGVDDDLREFHAAFARDPLIGRAVRAHPALRPARRPQPFEALVAAVTEQLIEIERAIRIQRGLIASLGRVCPDTGLRDSAPASDLAAAAPARLASFGLAESRAHSLRRVAREVAAGRIDLAGPPETAWRALRRIPGIGSWTVEHLAYYGHGRHDQIPAGDLGYLKLVGRLVTGRPRARADEAGVREFFARYGAWRGLAGQYMVWAARRGLLPALDGVAVGRQSPRRAA